MMKPTQQKQCDDWNKKYPIGTEVILTDDLGQKHQTKTTSAADLLGGHTPVIWTEYRPCYLLTRIQPSKETLNGGRP